MEIKPVKFSDPVQAEQLEALFTSVADLARRIPDASGSGIVQIPGGQYNVKQSDRYLICDARGGPIKIVLPSPAVQQSVTVKSAYTSDNSVTIVRNDSKPLGNGVSKITAAHTTEGAATVLLCDGSQWWVL